MKLDDRYVVLILGALWGVLEGLVLLWAFLWAWPYGVKPCIYCTSQGGDFVIYGPAMLGFALWIAIGISAVMGFVLEGFRETIHSLILSQPIVVIFALIVPLKQLFLASLVVLLFFFSLLSGISGVSLRERLYPPREFRVGWIPLAIGLVIQSFIVAIPVSMLALLVVQGVQFSQAYLSWAMPVLVLIGLAVVMLGIIVKGYTASRLVGPLMIASFVLGSLTIVSISFVSKVLMTWDNAAGPDQILPQFRVAIWSLYPSLLAPVLVFLRLLLAESRN